MNVFFVDESKVKGYTMVATLVSSAEVPRLKSQVRSLILPGQRRIHFTKENDQRRRLILSKFALLGFQSYVFQCDTKNQVQGRDSCLTALVEFAGKSSCSKIVIERDLSIEKTDRKVLYREVQRLNLKDKLEYAFEIPHQEPLLWVADAIAWSYTKGKDWKKRASPMIAEVISIP